MLAAFDKFGSELLTVNTETLGSFVNAAIIIIIIIIILCAAQSAN
jgi:hypothetical protein